MKEAALKTFRNQDPSFTPSVSPVKPRVPPSPQQNTHTSPTSILSHFLKKTSASLKRTREHKGKGKEVISVDESDSEIEELDKVGRPVKRVRGGDSVSPAMPQEVIVIDDENGNEPASSRRRPSLGVTKPIFSSLWDKQRVDDAALTKELGVFRASMRSLRYVQ